MKAHGFLAGFTAAALLVATRDADGVGELLPYNYEVPTLSTVTVTIVTDGPTNYAMSGNVGSVVFTSEAAYDPRTGQTKETLAQSNGSKIKSTAICTADPWLTGIGCSGGQVSAQGSFNPETLQKIITMQAPVSAYLITGPDRERIKAAYEKKLADRAAIAKGVRVKSYRDLNRYSAVATPTPSLHAASVKKPAGLDPTMARAPSKAPAYGATYAPGAPPALVRVGQTFTIPVLLTNTSSQNWPAAGPFKLSYHWVVNGQVSDGVKTALLAAAAPGASDNVVATVKAPFLNGRWTIRWDMYQEGVGFFSSKGIPTKNQDVTISP